MKSTKKTRKLEFTKETIARLGEGQLGGLYGGTDGGQYTLTRNMNTCTCTTNASLREPCNE